MPQRHLGKWRIPLLPYNTGNKWRGVQHHAVDSFNTSETWCQMGSILAETVVVELPKMLRLHSGEEMQTLQDSEDGIRPQP
jgi:hypothetical protein